MLLVDSARVLESLARTKQSQRASGGSGAEANVRPYKAVIARADN